MKLPSGKGWRFALGNCLAWRMHEASAGQRCRYILVRGQTRRGAFAAPKGSARRADRTDQKQAVERSDAVDGIPKIQPGALDSLFLIGPAAEAPPRRYLAAWQRPKAAFFRVPKKSMSDCLMLLASAWLNSYCIGMWPRGEGGAMVGAATLSLALNLLLTGVFILLVKRLITGQESARPSAMRQTCPDPPAWSAAIRFGQRRFP